jgi:nucleobase:cation symporter-1, NCS1 family
MVVVLTPLLPGLAYAISPTTVSINQGLVHLYSISWLYGFHVSIFLFWLLNAVFPPTETFVPATISAFPEENTFIDGIEPRRSSDVQVEKGLSSTEKDGQIVRVS